MQLRLREVARSALFNWLAIAATLAVGFFLSPFVVHRLGNIAYGVWVLAVSSIAYLGLLDLGLASSVVRYVAKGYATGDHQDASDILSAVLWVRLQISAAMLLLTTALAAAFPYLFKVSAAMARDAQAAVLIVGVSAALTMSFGVFSSVLSALNRYDIRSFVALTQLAVRVIGILFALSHGHGIVSIAICELIATAIASGLLIYFARRSYPELTILLKRPRSEVLHRMWSYSFYAFVLTIAGQLIYQSDNLVVGAFISASAVTFYSIGNSLCRYTQQMIGALSTTFTPAASAYEATGNLAGLRSLYLNGTRATMVISLPIIITLIVRGSSFIGLWMGPQYAKSSGTVLIILAVALLFSLQNSPAVSIAWGVEKHKTIAKWAVGEGTANLALSVVLAHYWGIYGVAVGTLVPNLFVQLILWPRYVSRIVEVSQTEVFLKVWGPVFLCAMPFAAASYAVNRYLPAANIAMFALQTLALLPLFALVIGLLFRNSLKRQVFPRIIAYLHARTTTNA